MCVMQPAKYAQDREGVAQLIFDMWLIQYDYYKTYIWHAGQKVNRGGQTENLVSAILLNSVSDKGYFNSVVAGLKWYE